MFYYNYNIEVEFFIPDEQTAVQVSYSLSSPSTADREISALLKLNSYKPLRRLLVITYNDEKTITENGIAIEIIPVWKWLIEQNL